jgi:L-ectoine synthase
MIVRDFNEIVEGEPTRVVSDAQWTSVRMLLAEDGMGFSFHITFLERRLGAHVRVQEPLRSVYCMQGTGLDHRSRHRRDPRHQAPA